MGSLRAIPAFFRRLAGDDVLTLAASIAYAALLSLFPLLVGIVALLSRFVDAAHAQGTVMGALEPYLPPDALVLIRRTLTEVFLTRDVAWVLAFVALFWSGTVVAGALRHGLNRVLRFPVVHAFWHRKLVDLALVVLGGLFLSLSLIGSAVLAVAGSVPSLGDFTAFLLRNPVTAALTVTGPVVFAAAALLIVYRFLPNARVSWASLVMGTLSALLLVEVSQQAFFWYVGKVLAYPLFYGPLAGLVVFLIWVYLVALAVLIGGEVMAVVDRRNDDRRSSMVDR